MSNKKNYFRRKSSPDGGSKGEKSGAIFPFIPSNRLRRCAGSKQEASLASARIAEKNLINVKEIKHFLLLCAPLIAAFLAQKGMQFIDTMMMGWIGPNALAAGALATNIFITILVFCRGVLTAVGVSIVHERASGKLENIQKLLHQAIYLTLALTIPAILLAWQAPFYLSAMGQNAEVIMDTQKLLHGLLWGIPAYLLFFVLREFISAFALARAIMFVSIITLPLTFACNYILIYGKYGLPALGVAGIGYANAFVCWFTFASLLFYCQKQSVLKHYMTWRFTKPDWAQIKKLWITGFGSGMILVLDMGTFLATVLLVGYFGVTALAAYQIALQCVSIAYNLPSAISVITALEIGHAFASRNWPKVKRTFYYGLLSSLVISICLSIFFIGSPKIITRLFLPDPAHAEEVFAVAQEFLIAASFLLCFDGAQSIILAALRGLNDTFWPMIMSVICYLLIGLTAAYLLSLYTPLQAIGVWYGLLLGLASLCAFAGWRWRRKVVTLL